MRFLQVNRMLHINYLLQSLGAKNVTLPAAHVSTVTKNVKKISQIKQSTLRLWGSGRANKEGFLSQYGVQITEIPCQPFACHMKRYRNVKTRLCLSRPQERKPPEGNK